MHLQIMSDKLSQEEVDSLTQDLCLDLSETGEVAAKPETRPLDAGERGVATVIGGAILEVLKTAGAAKLIEVLGAYLTQDRSIEATITTADGTTFTLNAKNVRSADFQAALTEMVAARTAG